MSYGDVDRFHAVSRSQRGGNNLAIIDNVAGCSTCFIQRSVRTAKQGLGATDCRNIEEESQMGCQAEATGMGHSLPIDNEQVGRYVQFPARRENQRRLAEGQISGHVRPAEFAFGSLHLNSLQSGIRDHDNRCPASPTDTVH